MSRQLRRHLACAALALLGACAPAAPAPPTPAAPEASAAPAAPTPTPEPAAVVAPTTAPTAAPTSAAPSAALTATAVTATAVAPSAAAPTAAPVGELPPPTATPAFPEARITEANLPALQLLRAVGLGGAVHAALAPDNRLLAVATTAGVALFELPSLRHLRLDPIPGGAARVAFTDDGAALLVTTSGAGEIQRRRVADGGLVGTGPAAPLPFPYTVDSPGGALRATLPFPDSVPAPGVVITRLADGATLYSDDDTLTASFSPDGATAALVTVAGDVRLVDTATGSVARELALPEYWGAGFTPDAQTLLTTGRSVWLWDVVAGTPRGAPLELDELAAGADFGGQQRVRASADGGTLTVEGLYGYFEASMLTASAWRVEGGALAPAWTSSAGGPGVLNYETYSGALSPASPITARTEDGVTLELDGGDAAPRSLQIPEVVSALAFSPDGSTLAVGDRAGGVRLVPVAGGPTVEQGRLGGRVLRLAFSPDGALLGARGVGGLIEIWRVGAPGTVASVQNPSPSADSPAWQGDEFIFTADGELLVAWGVGGLIEIWRAGAPAPAASVQDPSPSADTPTWQGDEFIFTADNELLITWGAGSVRFYRVSDGALVYAIQERATEVAIGPRRRLLALVQDGRVLLYGVP